jgi:hypothetical protein
MIGFMLGIFSDLLLYGRVLVLTWLRRSSAPLLSGESLLMALEIYSSFVLIMDILADLKTVCLSGLVLPNTLLLLWESTLCLESPALSVALECVLIEPSSKLFPNDINGNPMRCTDFFFSKSVGGTILGISLTVKL